MPAIVDNEKCTGCEACVSACPVEAISMNNAIASVNEADCTDCGICVAECPAEAISQ